MRNRLLPLVPYQVLVLTRAARRLNLVASSSTVEALPTAASTAIVLVHSLLKLVSWHAAHPRPASSASMLNRRLRDAYLDLKFSLYA